MIQLYPSQEPYVDKMQNFILTTDRHLDLNIPTGMGKSMIFNSFIDRNPSLRVLYVAHNMVLLQQAEEDFKGLSNVTITTRFKMLRQNSGIHADDFDVVILGDYLPGIKYNLLDFKKQMIIRNTW